MKTRRPSPRLSKSVLIVVVGLLGFPGAGWAQTASSAARAADAGLDRQLKELVAMPGGPPGVIALVQRGRSLAVHAFGERVAGLPGKPGKADAMRIASIAKAFNAATALALVSRGVWTLDATIGQWRPDLPVAWHAVRLRELLNHTSGLPDFTRNETFHEAVEKSPLAAPPPTALLAFVADEPLRFTPGTRYSYSNSDNIAVGLMIESATHRPYEDVLQELVGMPLRLGKTSLPTGPGLPEPYFHGYGFDGAGTPEDLSEILAAGWSWASGGIVSTPANLNRFIRAHAHGQLIARKARTQQRRWIPNGSSEPPGPGRNSAGLGIYRYQTRCGTVLGHTGNIFGYTQFAAATPDGSRSVTVSMSLQRTQNSPGWELAVFEALRAAEEQAVCAALAR